MKTEIIKVDINNMDRDKLKYAADVIKEGGLVAFPTETVYGLGANALNEAAVHNIFKAKARPADNPLIVHVAKKEDVERLVKEIPTAVPRLIEAFWPGPLTLVMNKSDIVPKSVTAGLDTVAVRMPSHPVALELIRASGLPIAAPSANTSGRPSPTCAQHVSEDLRGKVDVIIDGGNTDVGLESTVLDATLFPPVILRPGGITPEQLESLLGSVDLDPAVLKKVAQGFIPMSPGLKYTPYSPKADVVVLEGELPLVVERINALAAEYAMKGIKVGIMATAQTKDLYKGAEVISVGDRDHPETIASNLFRVLREFDERNTGLILAEAIGSSGIGLAVMNRLNKAAGYNIIKV